MDLQVVSNTDSNSEHISISDVVFNKPFNESLVHQVVVSSQANVRQGTKAQKNRSDVRGGGAKPWRQKGSGRARAGTSSSPIWRSGGVTFAARPRDYSQKINKKMHVAAMRSILSELVRSERLIVIDELKIAEPKTKLMLEQVTRLNVKDALFIVSSQSLTENLYLSSRNLKNIAVCDVEMLDPVGLIAFANVVVTQDALKEIEERLS